MLTKTWVQTLLLLKELICLHIFPVCQCNSKETWMNSKRVDSPLFNAQVTITMPLLSVVTREIRGSCLLLVVPEAELAKGKDRAAPGGNVPKLPAQSWSKGWGGSRAASHTRVCVKNHLRMLKCGFWVRRSGQGLRGCTADQFSGVAERHTHPPRGEMSWRHSGTCLLEGRACGQRSVLGSPFMGTH